MRLRSGHDRQALAAVLLHESLWDEATTLADKHAADYELVGQVADGVMTQRAAWVINASRQQADALIARTSSTYYIHAVTWLTRMKKAHFQLGQKKDWECYLSELREQYRRRPALQAKLRVL